MYRKVDPSASLRVNTERSVRLSAHAEVRGVENAPREAEKFELPFEGKLSQDNRWVIMASLVSWEEFEEEYAQNFSAEMGAPALPFRVALGSLIIKKKLGISDRETNDLPTFLGSNLPLIPNPG